MNNLRWSSSLKNGTCLVTVEADSAATLLAAENKVDFLAQQAMSISGLKPEEWFLSGSSVSLHQTKNRLTFTLLRRTNVPVGEIQSLF